MDGFLNFGHLHHNRLVPRDNLFDAVWCPNWFLVVLLGTGPAIWLVRYRRRRRRWLEGHCRRCGYDLRATPERCPECGYRPGSRGAPAWGTRGEDGE